MCFFVFLKFPINAQWQPILSSICEAFKPSGISTWPSHLSAGVTLPCSSSHLSLTLPLLPVLHPYNSFLPSFCLVFYLYCAHKLLQTLQIASNFAAYFFAYLSLSLPLLLLWLMMIIKL